MEGRVLLDACCLQGNGFGVVWKLRSGREEGLEMVLRVPVMAKGRRRMNAINEEVESAFSVAVEAKSRKECGGSREVMMKKS